MPRLVKPSSRWRDAALWLSVAPLVVLSATCARPFGGPSAPGGADVYFSEWQRIEAVREYVERQRADVGALPTSLDGLCAGADRNAWICGGGVGAATRDRWGNTLFYERTNATTYQIGTGGPDGELGTDDDLIVHSEHELDRVHRYAGCYAFEVPDRSGRPARRIVALDTARVSALRAEWQAFGTAPPDAVTPKWHPWRHDSLLVSWAEVSRVLDLRLEVSGDSVTGVVHSPNGFSTWWDQPLPIDVRGVRLDCRTLGSAVPYARLLAGPPSPIFRGPFSHPRASHGPAEYTSIWPPQGGGPAHDDEQLDHDAGGHWIRLGWVLFGAPHRDPERDREAE